VLSDAQVERKLMAGDLHISHASVDDLREVMRLSIEGVRLLYDLLR
jgi:hypothetical protein